MCKIFSNFVLILQYLKVLYQGCGSFLLQKGQLVPFNLKLQSLQIHLPQFLRGHTFELILFSKQI